MSPLTIRTVDGSKAIELKRGLGMSELTSTLGEPDSIQDMKTGYVSICYSKLEFLGRPLGISICFFEGRFNSLSFSLLRAVDESYWQTDEDTFQMRLAQHRQENDEFLRSNLGKPTRESGGLEFQNDGVVYWSVTDMKGGHASMGLRFASD